MFDTLKAPPEENFSIANKILRIYGVLGMKWNAIINGRWELVLNYSWQASGCPTNWNQILYLMS